MKVVDTISRMSTLVNIFKKEGKTVGLVPTMGYFHEGHLSLIRAARKHTDVVVVSIFINPMQFGPKEDFEKYPRDLKRDEQMATAAGADIIFYPSVKDIYPAGYSTYVIVESLTDNLCGASRPGHFKGVTTIVAKLFNIVKPSIAYFGQKDAQQAVIIKKMVQDLNMGVEVKVMPIVREADGLAMSSRNVFLSASERRDAVVLRESLKKAESAVNSGEKETKKIIKIMEDAIARVPGAKIDYISIVSTADLKDVKLINREALIAIAVFIGKTRLIDNVIIKTDSGDIANRKG
ncbi:MAG: pantoate--beta-alanine ligase [Candidatus Omnitrophica bacterium]|nr:pantoate--beta-alanine ligase [Candidatus Omnitrophota bacterium]